MRFQQTVERLQIETQIIRSKPRKKSLIFTKSLMRFEHFEGNKKRLFAEKGVFSLTVCLERFEPPTLCSVGRCSIR